MEKNLIYFTREAQAAAGRLTATRPSWPPRWLTVIKLGYRHIVYFLKWVTKFLYRLRSFSVSLPKHGRGNPGQTSSKTTLKRKTGFLFSIQYCLQKTHWSIGICLIYVNYYNRLLVEIVATNIIFLIIN